MPPVVAEYLCAATLVVFVFLFYRWWQRDVQYARLQAIRDTQLHERANAPTPPTPRLRRAQSNAVRAPRRSRSDGELKADVSEAVQGAREQEARRERLKARLQGLLEIAQNEATKDDVAEGKLPAPLRGRERALPRHQLMSDPRFSPPSSPCSQGGGCDGSMLQGRCNPPARAQWMRGSDSLLVAGLVAHEDAHWMSRSDPRLASQAALSPSVPPPPPLQRRPSTSAASRYTFSILKRRGASVATDLA